MNTLVEIEFWLENLHGGHQLSIDAGLFSGAPGVTNPLGLVTTASGTDSIEIEVTSVDESLHQLTGTTSILGEDGCTVLFTFAEEQGELTCVLRITLPADLQWTLIEAWNAGFGDLEAVFAPVVEHGTVSMSFGATITAESMQLPILLNVPSFNGDWTLNGNFDSFGKLTQDGLTALLGGNDIVGDLFNSYFDLADLEISWFEAAFNPFASPPTFTYFGVALTYKTDWNFGSSFKVTSITLAVDVIEPFPTPTAFQADLAGTMTIGTADINVGAQFISGGSISVFATLTGGAIDVDTFFTYFGVTLPTGFPVIVIDQFSFFITPSSGDFRFSVGIKDKFSIFGGIEINFFDFEIAYQNSTASGSLFTSFTIASTTLMINGQYEPTGLNLTGSATNVEIGALISDIASLFPPMSVPAPIGQLTLQTLTIALATGTTNSFTFTCAGTTDVASVNVGFTAVITATSASSGFSGGFTGTLIAGSLEFTVAFSETPSDTRITATYNDQGQGLTFQDIAGAFGFSLPPIPSDLNLDLQGAAFTYDFTKQELVFGAKSANYGNVVYVSTPISGMQGSQNFFVLDCGQSFSLSDLPLIGQELAAIENVSINDLSVVIASTPVTPAIANAVNPLIQSLGTGYPQLPQTTNNTDIILSANVVIGGGSQSLVIPLGGGSTTTQALAVMPGASAPAGSSPQWITIQQSFGPVTIQKIGISYDSGQQVLWFYIDAGVAFGPLTLTLTGLGIGSPITSFSPQFSLQGLGVSYANPPLQIAGGLVNLSSPDFSTIECEGGVTIGSADFTLQAFGYYGNTTGFPSMFVFGTLNEALGGPPAFFVTGAAAGFGYNSGLTLPAVDQVQQFPFVEVLPQSTNPNTKIFGSNPTPLSVLQTILGENPPWVTPTAGALWFAAGITFTSFSLVNSQALLIVDAGSELIIALLGTSHAQFPQAGSGTTYANIDLELEAQLIPSQGVFSVQAVLASSSYLLDPACVLTGGFAFFVWFGDSDYAGDFVLTLGGYNPSFSPPPYYPAVPPVGFDWNLDSSITISGNAYFALTPAVLMAGGSLSATYQAGNLQAWFDAEADLVARWNPFWFYAQVEVSIGASYSINLLFTTLTLSVELGCELELWGPPTGGQVTVDWYVISFTIPFGSGYSDEPLVTQWSQVEGMIPNTGSASAPNVLTLNAVSGLTTDATNQAAASGSVGWAVRGSQFGFSITTVVPVASASIGATFNFTGSPSFDVHPLGWTGVTSSLTIQISDAGNNDLSGSFNASALYASLPAALWGSPPESNGQPEVPSGNDQLVSGQLVGATATIVPPAMQGTTYPVNVAQYLTVDDLDLASALMPLSDAAARATDVPSNTQTSFAAIASETGGIGAWTTFLARSEVLSALGAYAPATANELMVNFAQTVGCAFAAQPLITT